MKILVLSNVLQADDLGLDDDAYQVIFTQDLNFETAEAKELVLKMSQSGAEIVIFGPDSDDGLALASVDMLRRKRPGIACVAYGDHDPGFMVMAMRHGFRDVIGFDEGPEELVRSLGLLINSRRILESQILTSNEPTEQNTLITVIGPKGGVGKTTIAVNMAFELATRFPNEVVLVDLDLVAGEVSDLLQIESASTVATVATRSAQVDATSVKLSLTSHPSGLLILPAPSSLAQIEQVDLESLEQILHNLAESFKYVIVDTGPGSTDASVLAVKEASDIVAVLSPEVGAIRTMQRYIEALDTLGLVNHRRHFVLNKEDAKTGVAVENVEAVLSQLVPYAIPTEKLIPAAGNQGIPFLETNLKGTAAGTLRSLTYAVAGIETEMVEPTVKKNSWFK